MPKYTYADANREFMTSEEMRRMADPASIGARPDQRQFLENRLIEAFRLGLKKGEEIAAERVAKLMRGET